MELKISDGERSRYTQIYGVDPLACDGWVTRRVKHELTVLGCDIGSDFDLLNAGEGQIVEAPATRGGRRVVCGREEAGQQRERLLRRRAILMASQEDRVAWPGAMEEVAIESLDRCQADRGREGRGAQAPPAEVERESDPIRVYLREVGSTKRTLQGQVSGREIVET